MTRRMGIMLTLLTLLTLFPALLGIQNGIPGLARGASGYERWRAAR